MLLFDAKYLSPNCTGNHMPLIKVSCGKHKRATSYFNTNNMQRKLKWMQLRQCGQIHFQLQVGCGEKVCLIAARYRKIIYDLWISCDRYSCGEHHFWRWCYLKSYWVWTSRYCKNSQRKEGNTVSCHCFCIYTINRYALLCGQFFWSQEIVICCSFSFWRAYKFSLWVLLSHPIFWL